MVAKGVYRMSNIANNPVGSPELQVPPYDGGRATFVVPETWPEQNRRRGELIHKKYYGGGLDAEEQAEFARLQAIAHAIIDAALPPLMLTPAERAYVDSKAGH